MDAGLKRSLVNWEQLNTLLDFMKEHPDLAKGLSRGRRGKLMTVKVWKACAKKLNSVKQGAVKDGKGWSKYWCDWKYRVRRHALELKAAKETNRLSDSLTPLSPFEETIISIIGENSLDDVVIKTDPLGEESNEDNMPEQNDQDQKSNVSYATRSKRRKRRYSSREVSNIDEPSSSPETKTRHMDNGEYSEDYDESKEFLKLEQQKLESAVKLQESVQNIATQLTRLTDAISRIRDLFELGQFELRHSS